MRPRKDGWEAASSMAERTRQFVMWSISASLRSSGQNFGLVRLMKLKTQSAMKATTAAPMKPMVQPPSMTHFCSIVLSPLGASCANRAGAVTRRVVVRATAMRLPR